MILQKWLCFRVCLCSDGCALQMMLMFITLLMYCHQQGGSADFRNFFLLMFLLKCSETNHLKEAVGL